MQCSKKKKKAKKKSQCHIPRPYALCHTITAPFFFVEVSIVRTYLVLFFFYLYCTNVYNDHDMSSEVKGKCYIEVLTSPIIVLRPVCPSFSKFPFQNENVSFHLVGPPLPILITRERFEIGHHANTAPVAMEVMK